MDFVNGVPLDDERLRNCEPRLLEIIYNEFLEKSGKVEWDDIVGLDFAKQVAKEYFIFPKLHPELFAGLRMPPKGTLLFGPPGTGKTLVGRAIASNYGSTLFSVAASSLINKGEGAEMVRALFAVARCYQSAMIFIDEIDLLQNSTDKDTRQILSEFIVQWYKDNQVMVVGATYHPEKLEHNTAVRFPLRLYIPLPDTTARLELIRKWLSKQKNSLTEEEVKWIVDHTEGFSGADLHVLCSEAALNPLRDINDILASDVRPVSLQDFQLALDHVQRSFVVKNIDLEILKQWNQDRAIPQPP